MLRARNRDVWVRKAARVFDGTHRVSVEFGDVVKIRDAKGRTIHRYPAE